MSARPWYHEDSGNFLVTETSINSEENIQTFRIIADGLSENKAKKILKLLKRQLLKLGTNLDNIEDRNNKGRQASGKRIIENRKTASGEKSGMSRLTWKEIYEIRHKHDYENITQDKLSEIFKVSQSTILCIIKNKTWHDSNYTPQKSRLGRNQIG
jgi:hypothetical protein